MRKKLPRIQIGSTSVEEYLTRYIVHECIGCDRVDNSLCKAYINPGAWWRNGKSCPLASHVGAAVDALKAKLVARARIGQPKHKKMYKF